MCFQHLGIDSAFPALLIQCYTSLSLAEAKIVAVASPLFCPSKLISFKKKFYTVVLVEFQGRDRNRG